MAGRIIGSVQQITATIGQMGGRIRRAVNDQIEEEAREIQRIARQMVPYEKGNMEGAIKVESANQRRLWSVYVDRAERDDTGKYTVGTYLDFLHEGTYRLGPKSEAKQSMVDVEVGRKFLERAFEHQLRNRMIERIETAARAARVL